MTNAKQYFFLSAISYPFIALYDDGACILRAQENSSLPMKISVASNVVNLALNLLFVWNFISSGGIRLCDTPGKSVCHGCCYDKTSESRPGSASSKLFFHPAGLG